MAFHPAAKHPLYEKWISRWERQRHVIEGEDRIKQHDVDTIYLPRLTGQGTQLDEFYGSTDVLTSYEAYKNRACFMNATGRTREGLVGAIMRKDPDVRTGGQDAAYEVVGIGLESWTEIINETLDEVIGVGRFGHLVDMPKTGKGRPYVAMYIAEAITNWKLGFIEEGPEEDGRKRVLRVHLAEASGKYTKTGRELEQYRILHLGAPEPVTQDEFDRVEEVGIGGWLLEMGATPEDFDDGPIYFQELWLEVDSAGVGKVAGEADFERIDLSVPKQLGGKIWREIPFVFFNPTTNKAKPDKPMLLDLAVVNLSHYRNSADLEHGLHFTALPQPWLSGFKFDGHIWIGSGVAWVSDMPDAKAGMLEFTGAGLGAIESRMAKKEKQMAALGARLLEEQPKAGEAEATETVKLRQSGEGSATARVSTVVSKGLTQVQRFLAMFLGSKTTDLGTDLNTDFGITGIPPELLTALMQQVQSGLMSWDTYVYNVRKGELYPDGWTNENEATAITGGTPGQTLDALMQPLPEAAAPPDV